MTTPIDHANQPNALHAKGDPLILFSNWDSGSASRASHRGQNCCCGKLGRRASPRIRGWEAVVLLRSSHQPQTNYCPLDIPVIFDLDGIWAKPEGVQQTVMKVMEAGTVGINPEDQKKGEESWDSSEFRPQPA